MPLFFSFIFAGQFNISVRGLQFATNTQVISMCGLWSISEISKSIIMFESLSEKLESAFKQIKGEGRVTELNIAATVKEIRRALVDADVNYKIAKEFTDKIKDEALGQKVINAISPGQLMVKIVKDELVNLM